MYFELVRINDVQNYIGKRGSIIVDLRTKEDYDRGHIPSAINIPYESGMNIDCYVLGYSYIYLYCQRGVSSMQAARGLCKMEAKVYSLAGGINAYRGKLVKS